MAKILCLYYSRTGNTRTAMEEIAGELDAELVEITDGVDRSGHSGFLRSGLEAMKRSTRSLDKIETKYQIEKYDLVILGTPVWAGRCSSPMRGVLKRRGLEMERVCYVLTRKSGHNYKEIYDQMDLYTKRPHLAAVSLRPNDTGYIFWRDKFIQDVKRWVGEHCYA